MRLIKAGVSKSTGTPYGAFYSCPDCRKTLNPPTDEFIAKEAPKETPKEAPKEAPKVAHPKANGDEGYVEGKKENTRLMCRSQLMVELVRKWNDITMIRDLENIFNELWAVVEK